MFKVDYLWTTFHSSWLLLLDGDVTRNARGAPRARARPVTASQLIQGEVKEMNQGADQEDCQKRQSKGREHGGRPRAHPNLQTLRTFDLSMWFVSQ